MKLRKVLMHGQAIPPYYGVAWTEFFVDRIVCYPIPLNVLIRLFRECLFYFKHGFITSRMSINEAYSKGYEYGLKNGKGNAKR